MSSREIHLVVTVILIFFSGASASTGYTETAWKEIIEDSSQCVEWSVMCDTTRQQLACCRSEVLPVRRFEEVTRCAEGYIEDSNGSCSIHACDPCPSHTYCLTNGSCANFCELSNANHITCICTPGFSRYFSSGMPTCVPNNSELGEIMPIAVLEQINRADNKTLLKIKINKNHAWSNRNGFNRFSVTIAEQHFPQIMKYFHVFYRTGQTRTSMSFRKANSSNARTDSLTDINLRCVENSTIEETVCSLSTFDRFIDHGDILSFQIRSYYSYSSLNDRMNRSDQFSKTMNIGFDFQPPQHCVERDNSCHPLIVSPEISKGRIHIEWRGWEDNLSGIIHYVLRIYKLVPDQTGNLRQPVDSCLSITTNITQTDYDYLPSEPGVYAILLMVEDNASNRNYARRFVLYDNTSKIVISNTSKLYFSSASKESNYHWQKNNTAVFVRWKDHFVNSIHDKGHFLSRIVGDPILVDNSSVIPTYDDHDGKIQLSPIPNVRGIIRFDYVRQLAASRIDDEPDTENWKQLDKIAPESLSKMFTSGRGDGSLDKVWIKAYDIMGHTSVDSTYVYFDTSPPTAYGNTAVMHKNIYPGSFSTRVSMEATDQTSGIFRIEWDVQDKQTNRLLASGFTAGNRTNSVTCNNNVKECRCVADGTCYLFKHYLYIDHCLLQMSKVELQVADLTLLVRVLNNALLANSFTMEIGKATTLSGIRQYSRPIDIHTPTLSTDSVKIVWAFEKNCYTRTGLRVTIGRKGQEPSVFHDLRRNVTEIEMIGLLPSTEYAATFVVHYGNESSDSFEYLFTTGSVKLETKYVVVIVILSLAASALLIGLFLILRKRRNTTHFVDFLLSSDLSKQSMESGKESNGSTRYEKTKNSSKPKTSTVQYVSESYEDTAIKDCNDEDVYEDLDGHIQMPPNSGITDFNVDTMISEGSFTSIYVGTCCLSTIGQKPCAFKTTSLGLDEEEIQAYEEAAKTLFKFHETHSIQAANILRYYGFINEGKEMPSLVMEYCANGTFGNWLEAEGNQVQRNDLQEIVLGIASGMEYLVARKIFHGNLTSFNILLNSDLQPKIKRMADEEPSAKSWKWQSPERYRSDTMPNEKSDVWSYGVVIWEAFSQGYKPYEGIADSELEAAIQDGHQLSQPDLCPDEFNAVIVTCMQQDPISRPTFIDLVDAIKDTKNYISVEEEVQEFYENTETAKM